MQPTRYKELLVKNFLKQVCLFIHSFVCLFAYLFIHLFVCLCKVLNSLASFYFLRFLCPALVAPVQFDIIKGTLGKKKKKKKKNNMNK